MTFEEWQQKHGPNGGAYDIEMMRAGWDAATRIDRESCAKMCEEMAAVLLLRRDDSLATLNHIAALTLARQAQTARLLAGNIRSGWTGGIKGY